MPGQGVPDTELAAKAHEGQLPAIRRPGHRLDFLLIAFQGGDVFSRIGIPDHHGETVRSRRQPFAIRAPGKDHRCAWFADEVTQQLARGDVPNFNVCQGGGNTVAIRIPGQGIHGNSAGVQGPDLESFFHIPEYHQTVPVAHGQLPAVRAPGQRSHARIHLGIFRVLMGRENKRSFSGRIPNADGTVPFPERQPLAIRTPADARGITGLFLQGKKLLGLLHVPDFHGFINAGRDQMSPVGAPSQRMDRAGMGAELANMTFSQGIQVVPFPFAVVGLSRLRKVPPKQFLHLRNGPGFPGFLGQGHLGQVQQPLGVVQTFLGKLPLLAFALESRRGLPVTDESRDEENDGQARHRCPQPGNEGPAPGPANQPAHHADWPCPDRLVFQEAVQIVRQVPGTGVTLARLFLQALQADGFQIARHLGLELAERHRLLVQNLHQGVQGVFRPEGRTPREHLVQDGTQGIYIDQRPDFMNLAPRLFRGHVAGGPQDRPGLSLVLVQVEEFGQAKVGYLGNSCQQTAISSQ